MDNEYADVNDIPGNIVIQPYMFEPPQRPNNQESSEESDNGDEDDQQDRRINMILVSIEEWSSGLSL